jgi:peptide/nickel transport system substrate-binding protein
MKADIDAARTESDAAKRLALYHKIVSHAREQAYFSWLVVVSDLYGTSARLQWEPRTDAKLLVKEMTAKN